MSRAFGARPFIGAPSMATLPVLSVSSPATMRSNVDFPQPEGPRMVTNSPALMSRSMPSSTIVSPNRLPSPATRTAPRTGRAPAASSFTTGIRTSASP